MSERKARRFWIAMNSFNNGEMDVYETRVEPFDYTPPAEVIEVVEVLPDDELERLRAENADIKRQLSEERAGNCDDSLAKHLRWENDRLKRSMANLSETQDKLYHASREVEEVKYKLGHELERLRAENERLKDECSDANAIFRQLIITEREVKKLREAAAGLREALEFYADEFNQTDQVCCGNGQQVSEEYYACCGQPINSFIADGGKQARSAIAKFDSAMKGDV